VKTEPIGPETQRGGAAKEGQNAKGKAQNAKPGMPRGGAAKENQKADGKWPRAKVKSPC
jgi:hypothetical protein